MEILCVTRHKGLYEYLVTEGLIPEGTPCLPRADENDVAGKHVYGKLPYRLAALCELYTELDLRIPFSLRGQELKAQDIHFYLIKPRTFIVKEVL